MYPYPLLPILHPLHLWYLPTQTTPTNSEQLPAPIPANLNTSGNKPQEVQASLRNSKQAQQI